MTKREKAQAAILAVLKRWVKPEAILVALKRSAKPATITAVVLVVLGVIYWFAVMYYADAGSRVAKWIGQVLFERWLFPHGFNLWNATPLFYLLLTIVLGCLALAVWPKKFITSSRTYWDQGYKTVNKYKTIGSKVVSGVLAALTLLSVVQTFRGFWDNDKDAARVYASATTFVAKNINSVPDSLSPLAKGAAHGKDGCTLVGQHDVPSCVIQGDYSQGWERRTASATGASLVMQRATGTDPNTNLLTDTLTYLYNEDGSGVWTAIRDGNNRRPLYGVVSWDGGGDSPQVCRFTGKYALNKAFSGRWGSNLTDEIASRYGHLFYDSQDRWGYCRKADDGSMEPIIVIPVTTQVGTADRTTLRPAGVLVIKGSPSGEANITWQRNAKAGDFPGPVYPDSMVEKQRDAIQWAAGRANKNRLNFGYETTNVESQDGNTSEFLLKSTADSRLYWVTPLKPRGSDSQQIVAYSVTPADEVTSGQLNRQRVYVLNDNDPRITNLTDMNNRVSQALTETNPGFFTGSTPGKVAEFLPVDDKTWQVYAERGGRVVYRVDVPSDARIAPQVTELQGLAETPVSQQGSGTASGGTPSPDASPCTKPPSTLSSQELAQCISEFANELAGRPQK